MKYLDKTPFSSKPSTAAYRDGWAGIDWGQRDRSVECLWERRPDGTMRLVSMRETTSKGRGKTPRKLGLIK